MEQLNEELVNAAINGQHKTVIELLKNPKVDPKWEQSLALNMAARYGHVECVRLLVDVSDPMDDNLNAIKQAISYGHLECVKILWARLHLTDEQHKNILKMMVADTKKASSTHLFVLENSNVQMDENYFLHLFTQNVFNTADKIRAVGAYFDVINNLNLIRVCELLNAPVAHLIHDVREQHIAEQQHLALTQALGDTSNSSYKKKM